MTFSRRLKIEAKIPSVQGALSPLKIKHDGQKKNTKPKLVTRSFQETLKPQSDSPSVSKESFKLFMAVAANSRFRLASVDIRAAFLQSRTLDRDVFVEPQLDIKKPGIVWRLNKPLYGLDNTYCKSIGYESKGCCANSD